VWVCSTRWARGPRSADAARFIRLRRVRSLAGDCLVPCVASNPKPFANRIARMRSVAGECLCWRAAGGEALPFDADPLARADWMDRRAFAARRSPVVALAARGRARVAGARRGAGTARRRRARAPGRRHAVDCAPVLAARRRRFGRRARSRASTIERSAITNRKASSLSSRASPHEDTAWQALSCAGPLALLPFRGRGERRNSVRSCGPCPNPKPSAVLALSDGPSATQLTRAFGRRLGALRCIRSAPAFPLRGQLDRD
jgi:2-octaprenyl-3-methyl-6-methoxy-1,4-benzoquinol hydroxylase